MSKGNISRQSITSLAQPKLEALFTKVEELSKINLLKESVMDCLDSPDELSQIITEMSILLVRIGGMTAELVAKANESYIYRKYRYLGEYHSLAGTGKDRENAAAQNIYEEQLSETTDRFVADFFKSYMDEHSRVIQVAQSRIGLMRAEIMRSPTMT